MREAIRGAEAISRSAPRSLFDGAPGSGAPFHAGRSRGDPPPLRRLQRVLRALARSAHGLFLRVFPRRRRHARAGAIAQARPRLHQAAVAAGREVPRHRLRLGRPRDARGAEVRRGRDRDHALGEPVPPRQRAHPGGRAAGSLPRAAAGLPRLPGRGRVRQGREHRDVRARGAEEPRQPISGWCGGAAREGTVPEPRHHHRGHATTARWAWARGNSSAATCSRAASCRTCIWRCAR